MKKTAPKIETRERKFVLRWKICAIESALRVVLRGGAEGGLHLPDIGGNQVQTTFLATGSPDPLARNRGQSPFATLREPCRDAAEACAASIARRITSARWSARRPVPCSICSRQLKPSATIEGLRVGACAHRRAAGRARRSRSRRRSATLEPERAGHPAAAGVGHVDARRRARESSRRSASIPMTRSGGSGPGRAPGARASGTSTSGALASRNSARRNVRAASRARAARPAGRAPAARRGRPRRSSARARRSGRPRAIAGASDVERRREQAPRRVEHPEVVERPAAAEPAPAGSSTREARALEDVDRRSADPGWKWLLNVSGQRTTRRAAPAPRRPRAAARTSARNVSRREARQPALGRDPAERLRDRRRARASA